jgi:hypothetical protein
LWRRAFMERSGRERDGSPCAQDGLAHSEENLGHQAGS